jgi:hypothetical protein
LKEGRRTARNDPGLGMAIEAGLRIGQGKMISKRLSFSTAMGRINEATDPEEAGNATISVETDELALSSTSEQQFIEEHFADFLRLIQGLDGEHQDILLMYHLLGKTQTQVARLVNRTQTQVSSEIRRAWRIIGLHLSGGEPTSDEVRKAVKLTGLEWPKLAEAVMLWLDIPTLAGFGVVDKEYRFTGKMLREALHRMVEMLTAGRDRRMQAIGHYVEALLAGSAKGPT